jgi:hypothetical protein
MSLFSARKLFGRTAVLLGVVAALLIGVFVTSASACTCAPGGEGAKYQRATNVFTGVVLHTGPAPVGQSGDRNRFLVLVVKNHKGSVPFLINVDSYVQVATCGIVLKNWETYVVFTSGDASDFVVETESCSGTRLASAGPPITTEPPTTTTPPPPTSTTGPKPTTPGTTPSSVTTTTHDTWYDTTTTTTTTTPASITTTSPYTATTVRQAVALGTESPCAKKARLSAV